MVSGSDITQANLANAVEETLTGYRSLNADEKLGLLWMVYTNMGSAVTPAAPGAADEQMTQQLLGEIEKMDHDQQLQFMRDLVNRMDTPLTGRYGSFTKDNKLVFWYQLAEGMRTGSVVPVPEQYTLPTGAATVLNQIVTLDFNEQITLLRHAVLEMGPVA
ncbi:orange carotenoid protein N-terminal domain-containing protein [Lyngbya confervoides]|uniref:Orange carotenoid protein n=1 Tax=Lyngbya confervoides BDU141951 TaxID=1574623 RepID=A0ABD4T3Y6_9CYAN|nr:orange carotenoid protein N-terminal domain-containing protein [Lyngbya confervoides]MCM1983227.1 Orange carotenoid protein [Lyngbya confervoides BDU141951]